MRALLALAWAALLVVAFLGAARRAEHGERRTVRAVIPAGDLALTCDLLAVAVGAGLTPRLALEVASGVAPSPVGGRLAAVLSAAGGGERLADALEQEASVQPTLRPMLDLLVTSERSGAPVAPLLCRLAVEERARGRRAALAAARRLPVRLLFPLVFLLLPAFLVLTVAPAVVAGLR